MRATEGNEFDPETRLECVRSGQDRSTGHSLCVGVRQTPQQINYVFNQLKQLKIFEVRESVCWSKHPFVHERACRCLQHLQVQSVMLP